MQLVLDFLHSFWNVVIEMVNAIATISSRLLNNLLEILVLEHPCQNILLPSIDVEVSADHGWSLGGYPFSYEVRKPIMECYFERLHYEEISYINLYYLLLD